MNWKYLFYLLSFSLTLLIIPFSYSAFTKKELKIAEDKILITFVKAGTNIKLPIENSSLSQKVALVKVELLDLKNEVVSATSSYETFFSGSKTLNVQLPISSLETLTSSSDLLWYRLRYSIFTEFQENKETTQQGVLSLSSIWKDAYELNIVSKGYATRNSIYTVKVLAHHPVSKEFVSGVDIEGKIEIDISDEKEEIIKTSAKTDSNGLALLQFNLPKEFKDDYLSLEILSELNFFKQEISESIDINENAVLTINTDKPIYQPGQTLHIRLLGFDSSRQAIANEAISLEIDDPENKTIFKTTLNTSRFGVASIDWPLPNNMRLGNYIIEAEIEGNKHEARSRQAIKVSRYDLPTFTVLAKTILPYYLPDKTNSAEVEIKADYIFGKPVTKGSVKIVSQSDRYWNYYQQKYEVTEETLFEGKLTPEGKILAPIDFSKVPYLENLDCQNKIYKDIDLVAYVTDESTNQTEQKRFPLRISKNDIHLYVIDYKSVKNNAPTEFYLSANYADGTPAECNIAIYEKDIENSELNETPCQISGKPFLTLQTNKYGVAKVKDFIFATKLTDVDNYRERHEFIFTAVDKSLKKGYLERYIDSYPKTLNLTTDKSIYYTGETINVNIISNIGNKPLIIDISQGNKILESRVIKLDKGKGSFNLPYSKDYRGVMHISAYLDDLTLENYYEKLIDSKTVLFPANENLALGVKLNKDTYLPGEEVKASFNVKTPLGKPIESALGIVVFDKAVELRANTEKEFNSNSYHQSYNPLSYYQGNLAGIDIKEVNHLALSGAATKELDLVAEVLLNQDNRAINFDTRRTDKFSLEYKNLFLPDIKKALEPLEQSLNLQYGYSSLYPKSEVVFHSLLGTQSDYFKKLKDPWGMTYKVDFFPRKNLDVMQISCSGVDKAFDTDDDFIVLEMSWPYFKPYGEIITTVANDYFAKTGFLIKDEETLKKETLKYGLNLDLLVNPFGNHYNFSFQPSGIFLDIKVFTEYPNDFSSKIIWSTRLDYMTRTREKIQTALDKYSEENDFPKNKEEFYKALSQAGIDFSSLKDYWNQPFELRFDNYNVYNTFLNNKGVIEKDLSTIVAEVFRFDLVSIGHGRFAQTVDDFIVASFSNITSLSKAEIKSIKKTSNNLLPTPLNYLNSGAIKGQVVDITGAAISGAFVRLIAQTGNTQETTTNEDGKFFIGNLSLGQYTLQVEAEGFQRYASEIYVALLTELATEISLEVGGSSDIVEVSGQEIIIERSTSQVSQTLDLLPINKRNFLDFSLTSSASNQLSTPRLREEFPETLLWQPEIETSSDGQATLKFKLADNITTWKMAVVASTTDGQITTIDTEFQAFQPFFVELDPPKSLTEGDEISLPITLRNYLESAQTVTMDINNQTWLTALSPLKRKLKIPAKAFSQEIFDFRADKPINKGNQLVSVSGKEVSDAIKKPVDVLPYGEETTQTLTKILDNTINTFEINLPANALQNQQHIELKLYPNLLTHIAESIEGILKRPYGCGEQTISSTYPSLLMLKYLKQNNLSIPELEAKARNYLQIGYDRLIGYRGATGGFTYWGKGEENAALTVYALRFLNDAKEFISIDENIIKSTSEWILNRQQLDGNWKEAYYNQNESTIRSAQLTSYILMLLVRVNDKPNEVIAKKLNLAMSYLENLINPLTPIITNEQKAISENPYLLACYAQAALKLGYTNKAEDALSKLLKLVKSKQGSKYWELTGYTLFYGWGEVANIETTAFVLQAFLASANSKNPSNLFKSENSLINESLIYLLQNKDRYGIWYSTQTTVNVIDAILAVLSQNNSQGKKLDSPTEIYVNGKLATSFTLPDSNKANNALTIDLSKFASSPNNKIEIRNGRGSAQVVHTYYLPWSTNSDSIESEAMYLAVNFDKNQAKIGEEISCQVTAKRKRSGLYGMMLAEVGLPPGADVDRNSLKKAMEENGYAINHYDILPDRLIFYLWPASSEISFEFKFRERFALKAMSCRSLIYDYYNPEAKLTLAPKKFIIYPKQNSLE